MQRHTRESGYPLIAGQSEDRDDMEYLDHPLSRMRTPRNRKPYAARMFAMKRSSSSRSRVLSAERLLAEFNTSPEAEPVSVAPRLTCMMLAAASWVPCATV